MRLGGPEPPFEPGLSIGQSPSFLELLRTGGEQPSPEPASGPGLTVAHGTTVLGVRFDEGVVMAGDRRAVEGFSIADERMEKVFPADGYSAIGIAGAAGQAIEIVRLFQMELEHYEKVQGDRLSLDGKANRLAQMIRQNFPLAMQGLVVVPLFGGYDERRGQGRLFRYDVVGGRWEEGDFHATGSGGRAAKSTLKKRWKPDLSRPDAVRASVESLIDASEEDVATGGPNPFRGIYPTVKAITARGVEDVPVEEVQSVWQELAGEQA